MDDSKERFLPEPTGWMHTGTQRDCESTLNLLQIQVRWDPSTERKVRGIDPTSNPENIFNWFASLQKEQSVFSKECQWVCQAHSMAGSMPRSSWLNQNNSMVLFIHLVFCFVMFMGILHHFIGPFLSYRFCLCIFILCAHLEILFLMHFNS